MNVTQNVTNVISWSVVVETKSFGLNNLRKHLKTNHPLLNKELTEKEESKSVQNKDAPHRNRENDKHKQATLEESFVKVWDINSSMSQEIIKTIGEMICVDLQPVSIVTDVGFNR